jgi:RNA polymerase sigma-70 factor (ECF subfamily)
VEIEDDATRFVRLFMLYERRLRSFVFTLLGNRDATDEVMQEISMVLWKKFGQLEDDDCFLNWGYVIARFEVLMHRRRLARDRFVLDEGLMKLLSDEFVADELENADRSEQLRKSLDGCLESLRDPDRRIILTAYASGTKIASLAERMNVTPGSLYKWLGRIRRRLQRCVELKMISATN